MNSRLKVQNKESWVNRRRPALSATESVARKYEDMAVTRAEVAKLQFQILQHKLQQQTKEAEDSAKLLQLQIETAELQKKSALLDVKIKEKQLQKLEEM